MITITKSMAVELAPDKIRVNAINPVAGDTPLLSQFLPGEDTAGRNAVAVIGYGLWQQLFAGDRLAEAKG